MIDTAHEVDRFALQLANIFPAWSISKYKQQQQQSQWVVLFETSANCHSSSCSSSSSAAGDDGQLVSVPLHNDRLLVHG